jgi:hypothetical protein
MTNVQVEKSSLTLERIALAAVVMLLTWNVYTTQQLSLEMVKTTAELTALGNVVELAQSDRFTARDALADRTILETKIKRLEDWNFRLSDRLNEVEDGLTKLEERAGTEGQR